MELGTGDAAAVAHGDDPDLPPRSTADLQRALSRVPSEARRGPGGATGVGALDPGASLATPARTLAGLFQDLGSATRVPGPRTQVRPAVLRPGTRPLHGVRRALGACGRVDVRYQRPERRRQGAGDDTHQARLRHPRLGARGRRPRSRKLRIIANRRAEAASRRWVEDVRARKLTIANGEGAVHGRRYDLATQYGIRLTQAAPSG